MLEIRRFVEADRTAVIALWEACGLLRSWNDPDRDIDRKIDRDPDGFLIGEFEDRIVAAAMAGYDGHRGWVNYLAVDPEIFHPRADYLLRVVGMSMRDAGILHGDLLAVKRTRDVTSGQIVVARVNDEVTVKRFRRAGRAVRLIPENSDYATILIDLHSHSLEIEGLGVGVLRSGVPL